MRKPRILMVNEASFLSTGYSTYGLEVQTRLHESGKYELAELACYGQPDDPRQHELPWKYFGNQPSEGYPEQRANYESMPTNQFGEWAFNDVALQFKPDIVWDIRDWWMMEFAERSPFRRMFHWCIMPTVDATPQHESWLSTFVNADAVLTYSDWGRKTLEQEGGGLVKTRGSAPPAADTSVFVPMDRERLRNKFGFDDGINIVGTVMRNQPRKLYPQLIRDFAEFVRTAPPEIAKKTYLYLHTSYPDKDGWDIPRLIKQSGISYKILVTYKCKLCSSVFPAFFQDARGVCIKCHQNTATMPNVGFGVDRRTLASIMNLFDIYVQYSNSEGFGMPQVEAAACGIPVMATDYSAMSDVVRKINGYPINVLSLDPDPGTGCLRATPDGKDFIKKLIKFFEMKESERKKKFQDACRGVSAHYDWGKTTKQWMNVFDSLPLRSPEATWDGPPRIHMPKDVPAKFPSNESFVRWCIEHVLGRPEMQNSYMSLRLIRDLNWGVSQKGMGGAYHNEDSTLGNRITLRTFTTDDVVAELTAMCHNSNNWETKRCQFLTSQ